ncbi:MAG: 3-hydroxyacyl-[acyl-carrier-protein] dehydratase FabZ [Candidatus Omnitrophica bacterium CG11_big_fil_rev_8_21_14_0_20_41_12]|nr:MAG: 3-hydroxyacyl-[acyl-carrier-protein] dehydratase FabZ [Candidatus Omnitrophica bacterium CG11_big_fil_rev_8_21_14_0_20_41_12]
MDNQKTIAQEASLEGIGLHTGNKAKIVFKPGQVDSGINFVRVDLPGSPVIKAAVENVSVQAKSPRRTSLGKGSAEIHTIEHLMSVLFGLGIDNLIIEINNNEIPGMDGSGLDFIQAIKNAGIKELDSPRNYFVVREPIYAEEENASLVVLPFDGFKVSYTLNYEHTFLKLQFKSLIIDGVSFESEIAAARTFCLEDEAQELQQQGVGLGANYDNTLVFGKAGVIKNRLRFEDECIRHKMLDLLGDLNLLGQPIKGHIIALRSGHALNLKLVKKILQQKQKTISGGIAIGYQPVMGQRLEAVDIMKILPHRDPFLFVDRILELQPGKRAVGIKNVTINDYFFKGHFPQRPVMPGVLMLEAMAQVGGIMMLSPDENRGKLAFFMAINNVKFRKTVVPGDQLVFEVFAGKIKSKTGQVSGKAYVDGKVVVEADFMFALAETNES